MNSLDIEAGTLVLLAPEALVPDPNQPRQEKNWDIAGMAANMVELRSRGRGIRGTGVLFPLLVRLPPGALDATGTLRRGVRLLIVDGEGRWQSAHRANEEHTGSVPLLPCLLEDVGEEDAFEIAYLANSHRRPMSPLDEGLALLRIKKRHNLGYDRLAARVNQSKDYVRERLKAVAEEDTLPILEQRPDAISIVRRINQVGDKKFRNQLIQAALSGATKADIEDTIAAKRAGLSVGRFRAESAVRKLERAHEREAKDASSSGSPSNSGGSGTAKSRGAKPEATSTNTPSESDEQSSGLEVRPFIGDVLDVLLRQTEDAKNGLLSTTLSPERRADLIQKSLRLRTLADELLEGLRAGGD